KTLGLQPVSQVADRCGGQAAALGQLAAGQRAVPVEQVERLLLGGGQALARGQRGVKHHGRGTELAPSREQRVQQLPPCRVAARARGAGWWPGGAGLPAGRCGASPCRWCSSSWSPTGPCPGGTTTTSTGAPPSPPPASWPDRRNGAGPMPHCRKRHGQTDQPIRTDSPKRVIEGDWQWLSRVAAVAWQGGGAVTEAGRPGRARARARGTD